MFHFIGKKLLLFSTNPPNGASHIAAHLPYLSPKHIARTITTRTSSSADLQITAKTSSALSSKSALSASRTKVAVQLPQSSDLAKILASYGLSHSDASAVVTKHSEMLLAISEKTIKTKLDFFQGAGFTGTEVAEILMRNPGILSRNLDRGTVTYVDFLKTLVPSRKDIVRVLKYTNQPLSSKYMHNIQTLRNHGVPDSNILKGILFQPRALMRGVDEFSAVVEKVKGMGLDPKSCTFVIAVSVMSYLSKSTWSRKVKVFSELGWSDEKIFAMFKRDPRSFGPSDEAIRQRMGFFAGTTGWDDTFLATNPSILRMSFEKIIRRCSVLNILMSRDLIKKNTRSASKFLISKQRFYDMYVDKYKNDAPEVLEAYQGNIGFKGWDWLMDEKRPSDVQR